jgi:Holliday junction resolvase
MSKFSRDKGYRFENDVRKWHVEMGVHAERVPLSGGAKYKNGGHDLDIYAFGKENAPLVAECKIRAKLPKCWRDWLGENCAVFMRDNNGETMVILPARTWAKMVKR